MTEPMTVFVANYNKGRYLRECLESVLRQTSPHWRLDILDDGSTDDSVEILREYEHRDRIRIRYSRENRGQGVTKRRLVALAESDIVGELDSDDQLTPDCVEEILAVYHRYPGAGFVYSNFWFCDENLNQFRRGYCHGIPPGQTNLEANCVSCFRTFRKSEYIKTEGYSLTLPCILDKDLVYKMEEVTQPIFIDRELYRVRVVPNSISNGGVETGIAKQAWEQAKSDARRRRSRQSGSGYAC
jgi:glycosyltransferase involved in cell wall biosynthesis